MTVLAPLRSLKKRSLLRTLLVFFCFFFEAMGVRILEVKVPARARVDETIELGCYFDMQNENLYSLTWWKGSHQFYLFGPAGAKQPQKTIYAAPGIKVDRSLSGLNKIVLRNVTRKTSGRFKCEVVAELSYERDSKISTLEVVEVPHRAPVLSLKRLQFNAGEMLEANCSSPGIKPPSKLVWFINGDKISYQNTRMIAPPHRLNNWYSSDSLIEDSKVIYIGDMNDLHIMRTDEVPLPPITSALKIVLRPSHFINEGRTTLTCVAALPGLYYKSTEVQLTLPGVAPVTSSHRISKGAKIKTPEYIFWIFLAAVTLFLSFPNFDLFHSVRAHSYHNR